jgi:2-polyprenyl-3-methyl-5-hydroxy-6-metoxy-1,4-benzoquinol methylase
MNAPTPLQIAPAAYWEQRAQRFAARGEGLAAVCAYGMPEIYNRVIQCSQRLALSRWLQVKAGTRVLDVGCGVGRWSRLLAARGAIVSGVDLSPTMIGIARRRAAAAGLAPHCRFLVQDLAQLELGIQFDLVLGVTVLQHILDPWKLRHAMTRMVSHLATGGRMVLLEAAPVRATHRCDTAVFTARERAAYLELFRACGLRARLVSGVDPAPFKTWLLPHLHALPRPLSIAAIALASTLSLPVDALFGRWAVQRSWHALFVLEHEREVHDVN